MDWHEINWAEVLVLTLLFVVLLAVGVVYLLLRIEQMHIESERRVAEANRVFLRGEYARLAAESVIHQQQLRGLVGEVTSMALAVKEAVKREDWDPEEHLETLAQLDARLASLPVGPTPQTA